MTGASSVSRGLELCRVRLEVRGQPLRFQKWGHCWGRRWGEQGGGSWQARPRRKQSVCASALAEPGCETSCPSFQSEGAYDVILPRATANSQVMGSANSTLRAEDMYAAQSHQAATSPKDGKSSQVFRNPYVWD